MADPELRPSRFLDPAERAALHARIDRLPNYRARATASTTAPILVVLVPVVGVAFALSDGTIRGTALMVAQVTWTAAVLLAVRLIYRAGRRTRP
jgi:hypothetical protein